MILWDREMKRAKARARLRALPPTTRVLWATDALDHALEISLTPKLAKAADAKIVRRAIEAARRGVEHAKLVELAEAVEARMPDEDDEPPPGVADLLDGALALCDLLETPTAETALEVASFAYQAVSSRFLDLDASAGSEAAYRKAELTTPQCLREIELQLARLDALERGPQPAKRDASARTGRAAPASRRRA